MDDIDRPLAPRGIRSAKLMAGRLKDTGLVPGLIYTSPASRALNTALIMQGVWCLDPGLLEIHDELYMAYLEEITSVIEQAPDEASQDSENTAGEATPAQLLPTDSRSRTQSR